MAEKLLDAFLESVRSGGLMQGIITLFLVGLYGSMVYQGKPTPPELVNWTILVIGFYFGARTQGAINAFEARLRAKQ